MDEVAQPAASLTPPSPPLGGGYSISYPPDLPIVARREEIVAAIRNHQVVVLAGETGSGKTTQIPKMCLEAGLGLRKKIGCTQPRRVAALSISKRIAQELKVTWGKEVGCKIRFDDATSRDTRIKVMTDGILLAETQGDPKLSEYECLIIDEAHERSLNIDFLLGYLNLLLKERPDLKLIITSATIDTEAFSKAFNNAPIIEVSGRMYPVELIYAPFDEMAEDRGDLTYIDAAVNAVEVIQEERQRGDILIFLPGEKDIREARDLLQGRFASTHEVIPLFGRLSSGEQEKVFNPGPEPRIIIATNIAETSLTIPRVRYVIDAGLARISRYSPRTRTKRLPIEPISQSSANQRKGRCGRVADGVCIRLYSEEDFDKRPQYSQPEIQRANLAEVILRMKAFHLGDVETFPFINPPQPAAIKAGYDLLHEIGALDEANHLTPMGWDLARLPVDPAIGRMLLQAIKERVLPEALVIASGLSIQDPRERPMDAKEAAEFAHRRFVHPDSDFLTLLNLWNAYHDEFERLSQGQMRRFCKAHFLSYMRMREWRDLHAQLGDAIQSVDFTSLGPTIQQIKRVGELSSDRKISEAQYHGIHRSILAGLLGHIAARQEKNIYCATRNREVMIFPGSALFDKNVNQSRKKNPGQKDEGPKQEKTFQPAWIVAGEIVETSRLYARTIAGIDSKWVEELGKHVCNYAHNGPHWNAASQRVLVRERVSFAGLELFDRLVPFGKVNPTEATNLFIRAALIEEPIDGPYSFLKHNKALLEKLETWQTRMRSSALPDLHQALFKFYQKRITHVSSVPELNRLLKELGPSDKNLFATEQDLIGNLTLNLDSDAFPEQIEVANQVVPLQYSYAPGEEHDGVTARVPITLLSQLKSGQLEWMVPGWREEQLRELLRGLPKSLRVPLMPLEPKVKEIASELEPESESLPKALSQFIRLKYKVNIPEEAWSLQALPIHLRPRVEVVTPSFKPLATSRSLDELQEKLRQQERNVEQGAWKRACDKWEQHHLNTWSFGDLPPMIDIPTGSGVPLLAYPGLAKQKEGAVSLKLFRNKEEAIHQSKEAIKTLAEIAIGKDLGWLQKDLRALDKLKPLYITLGSGEELEETAFEHLKAYLFDHDPIYPLTESAFKKVVEAGRARLPGLLHRFLSALSATLELRQQILLSKKSYPGMIQELNALLPPKFLLSIRFERLQHMQRYLKAMLIRAERYMVNAAKDQEKQRLLIPWFQILGKIRNKTNISPKEAEAVESFRWLLHEYKVSLFAQELGTAQPVSARRVEMFLEESGLKALL
ncbi:MAG: ATP-dependent RNA helicase HrpA [Verrucomicrobiales bacterium]